MSTRTAEASTGLNIARLEAGRIIHTDEDPLADNPLVEFVTEDKDRHDNTGGIVTVQYDLGRVAACASIRLGNTHIEIKAIAIAEDQEIHVDQKEAFQLLIKRIARSAVIMANGIEVYSEVPIGIFKLDKGLKLKQAGKAHEPWMEELLLTEEFKLEGAHKTNGPRSYIKDLNK